MVSPPSIDGLVRVPAHLLESVLADIRCQRERERGESALLAAPGSPHALVGDTREAAWRAQNSGLAGLLDWMGGVS